MGDPAITPDPHELEGQDIVIEYHLHVQKVITLRFCTVLKGITTDGEPFSISLDKNIGFQIRPERPAKWWHRLWCKG
jgi:hypothetical protein